MNQSEVSALPAGCMNQSEVSALPTWCMNQSEVNVLFLQGAEACDVCV